MRPLELRLTGFRSYRNERTVDFRELDLVAIIGDTGAGKSSLLEAMTWALYGGSTWSKSCSTDLVAHGAKRMSVSLEFEAGGERWRVIRSFARSGASSAELACLSNAAIPKVDGVRQVDEDVEKVIGLKYEVFCSCVLLPQGKFERLLRATKTEKTNTLKSILRLEHLVEARDRADAMAGRLAARERDMLEARTLFRADPRGDAAAAEAQLRALRPEQERLEALRSQIAALETKAAGYDVQAREIGANAERLAARRGDHAGRMRALAQREQELAAAHRSALEAVGAALEDVASIEAEHAAATADQSDSATLLRVQGQLAQLADAVGRRADLGERADEDAAARGDGEAALAAAVSALESATAALTVNEAVRGEAASAAAGARADRVQVATAIESLTSLRETVGAAEARATEAEGEAAAARAAQAEVEQRANTAREAYDAAREAQAAAQRAHAVAHVAAGLEPGEPCPVCERELPDSFTAPGDPDQAAAEEQVRARHGKVEAADRDEREAMRLTSVATERAAALATTAGEARERLSKSLAAIAARVGDGDPAAALDGLVQAERAAAEAVDRLEAERTTLDAEHRTRETEATRLRAELEALARAITERERELSRATATIAQHVAAMPGWSGLGEPVAAEAVAAAQQTVTERLDAVAGLDARLATAREAATAAAARVSKTEIEIEREVRGPAGAIRTELSSLAVEVADWDGCVPEGDVQVADLIVCAQALEAHVDAAIAGLRTRAEEATAAGAGGRAEATALIEGAGFADRDELAARCDEARAETMSAERELDSAAKEIEPCERLIGLTDRAAKARAGFEELKSVLADRAFISYVVAHRQRALLTHASEVLQEITGRYAFTGDFRILDRESGLPRSPDTLSGGETFIASLALALGLVEVADRSGGDLRALFLDEGFGTLDAGTLDTALTALEERAKAGRLIGLISHVPTVAERIDTVLEIKHAVDGSDVTVLTGEARAARMNEGVGDAVAAF